MYQFSLSYYYLTEENDRRLTDFSKASGDTRRTLIMQYVRGWLGRNRTYYQSLAKLDIAKRGMDKDSWVEIVVNDGIESLPDYVEQLTQGDIPLSPLSHVVLPNDVVTREINYINLTKQNLILLKTAIYYDGRKIAPFISRVIHEHLDRNWQSLYASQVDAETNNNWLD